MIFIIEKNSEVLGQFDENKLIVYFILKCVEIYVIVFFRL